MINSVCLVSRQRIVGETNGSSTYILSIVRYLASRGLAVHYVCPTPSVFGRWPYLRLRDEMSVFASYRIRGAVKIGSLVINPNPMVALRATLAVFDRVVSRIGLPLPPLSAKPSHPFSEFPALTDADVAYLRSIEPAAADSVLCDYAVMTPAIQHLAKGDRRSAVVMHDLYSSEYAHVDAAKEFSLLGQAGLIVAIQRAEARLVAARLPGHPIAVAPMAVRPVDASAPGDSDRLLFVGSQTKPNVEALNWFIAQVWPILQAQRPGLVLEVAGTVASVMGSVPKGITLLGLVPDLEPLYRSAGTVISPLRSGTGLKIKLIEALSRGKALVATPVTVQGVEELIQGIVPVEDTGAGFAAAILECAADPGLRAERGERALALVREQFSEDRCYGPIHDYLTGTAQEPLPLP